MSMSRSPRFKRDKVAESLAESAAWPDLNSTSCLGKQMLSRCASRPGISFAKSMRMDPIKTGPIHTYHVEPKEFAKGYKYGDRNRLAEAEQRQKKKEAEMVVGPAAQYPLAHTSLVGTQTPFKKSAPAYSITRRPATVLVEPERLKYNAHHMADPISTVVPNRTLSRIKSSPMLKLSKAPRSPKRKPAPVAAKQQWPAGQVSSIGPQVLSTSRSFSGRSMLSRPHGLNPIPKQWTDVGPAGYRPPSTFAKAASKSYNRRRPHTSAAAMRQSASASSLRHTASRGGPPKLSTAPKEPMSLKEWNNAHTVAKPDKAAAAFGSTKVSTLQDWLTQYGSASKRSMFASESTRRPIKSRGLMAGMRTRAAQVTPEAARAALEESMTLPLYEDQDAAGFGFRASTPKPRKTVQIAANA